MTAITPARPAARRPPQPALGQNPSKTTAEVTVPATDEPTPAERAGSTAGRPPAEPAGHNSRSADDRAATAREAAAQAALVAGLRGEAIHRRRPNPLRWIGYAFGMGLPARNRGWVLFDATSDSWLVRHVARAVTMMSLPVAALLILLPGPIGLRLGCAAAGVVMGFIYSFAYAAESIETRLQKAGFPDGTGAAFRAERARKAQRARTERVQRLEAKRQARRR